MPLFDKLFKIDTHLKPKYPKPRTKNWIPSTAAIC